MMRSGIVAAVLFVLAHFAMLIGVTTPEKFYFDEVHYVPAARQMLEPVMPQPMLNPMHPPLAKQFIALSIHSFGDGPLGWRYPGVLFGSLAIVAVYLCGLALFAAQGPAIAASLLAFFNQMLFVQSRIAMLDIFALAFGLFAIAAFMHGFRRERPHVWFALAGIGFGLSAACKWSGLFVLAVCIVIVAVIRLMQSWRTQFADARPDDWYRPDLWPGFKAWHFALCFVLVPAAVYLATFIPLYGFSVPDILEAQRRIFAASMLGLMVASITTMIQVGFVIGVGILLDTFLVRTITVPAMAALVGRANWWPYRWWPRRRASKLAATRHRRRSGDPSIQDVYDGIPVGDNAHHRHRRDQPTATSSPDDEITDVIPTDLRFT